MNRRLLMGAATIGSAATLVTAASFASFNDTENIGPKTLTAGTLDLQKGWSIPLLFGENLKPGDTRAYTFELENKGSLDGDLKMKIVDLVDTENGANDVERKVGDATNSAGELSKYVRLRVDEIVGWKTNTIYNGNLRDGVEKVSNATGLRAREDRHYVATVEFVKNGLTDAFDVQAQNDAQGDTVSFDLKFALVQKDA